MPLLFILIDPNVSILQNFEFVFPDKYTTLLIVN